MFLNLDILHDIINYFEYPQDKETLRSLALTSRCLSNLALNVIWRNGECILDIISVINSFAPSPDEHFLEYIHEPGSNAEDSEDEDPSSNTGVGGWVLNEPLPHAARKRALEHLARIRELPVRQDGPPFSEEPVWPILSVSLNPRGPLLPNLRCLEIEYLIYDHNEYLTPLLSPSLKTLVLSSENLPKLRAILTLLNLAKAGCCDLEEFVYYGPPIEYLPEAIMRFKNLQSVVLPLEDDPLQRAAITIVAFLTSLPSLRSLTCHLATFLHPPGKEQFYHTGLQKIEIQSSPGMLRKLFCQCVFPSVTEVRVQKDNQIPSLEGLESCCPDTCKLEFGVCFPINRDELLEFRHLASLSSLPIQVFTLEAYHHELTPSHLHTFMQFWPNLRTFEIFSLTNFDPLPSLTAFSTHPRLEKFNVEMLLYPLLGDIPKIRDLMETHVTTQGCISCVHTLVFTCSRSPDRTPTMITTSGKRVLVEYLNLLFPSLENLKLRDGDSNNSFHRAELAELQEILLELRMLREDSANSA